VSGDVGARLRVVVTAANPDGASSAISHATDVIRAAAATAPRNTAAPSISGTTRVGETLTANPGTWVGAQPINFSFRWYRCDHRGDHCAITSVTSQSYTLTSADAGRTIRVLVTATNAAGAKPMFSPPTGVVAAAAQPSACVSINQVALPDRLIVDRIQWSPTQIHSHGETIVGRFHVTNTRNQCVAGALVYALGVPFDRLSKAGETPTGGDGWAQISFKVLPTFQLRHGNFVVVFVRARRGGENLLAGVSTRRLVSIRVA
jgi:hypothetical protein